MREHAEIRAVLPQRYPLLLVDRVLDIDPGRSICAIKAVTGTEPCYADVADDPEGWRHGYPYSLIIESFGQAAALLWLEGRVPDPTDNRILMLAGARDIGFAGTARPGDVLRHEVRLDTVIADTAFASGATWIGDRRMITIGRLVLTLYPVRVSGLPPPPDPLGRAGGPHLAASHRAPARAAEGSR